MVLNVQKFKMSDVLSSTAVKIITLNSLHVKTMKVVVYTDSIRIHFSPPYENKWITLEPSAIVFVLNTIKNQASWCSCTLDLSPHSNVADDTGRFLTPGDYVGIGNGKRMEEEDWGNVMLYVYNNSHHGMHEILKLNPSAIHGGVFVIRLK